MNRRRQPPKPLSAWFDRTPMTQLSLDLWTVIAACGLTLFGLVMVASASVAVADQTMGDPLYYFKRQAIFITLGLLGIALLLHLPMAAWRRLSALALPLAAITLLLVFVPGLGFEVKGSRRWIDLQFFNLQAVEAVKMLLIIYLAGYFVRHRDRLRSELLGVVKPVALACILAALLLLQPDFGGAVVILAITGGLVFLAGARWLHLGLLAAIALPTLWVIAKAEEYRLRRLGSFLNPWADPYADGFQLTQALIAIGRGEFTGVGLGAGVQKLFYLPEAHTDFIVAVMAEELGFVGVLVLMTLFAVLVARILLTGLRAEQADRPFSAYICYGVGLWFGLQAVVSIGVNLGVLPTKGLTLPLVSSGGSSLLMCAAALGFVLRIGHELNAPQSKTAKTPASIEPDLAADDPTAVTA